MASHACHHARGKPPPRYRRRPYAGCGHPAREPSLPAGGASRPRCAPVMPRVGSVPLTNAQSTSVRQQTQAPSAVRDGPYPSPPRPHGWLRLSPWQRLPSPPTAPPAACARRRPAAQRRGPASRPTTPPRPARRPGATGRDGMGTGAARCIAAVAGAPPEPCADEVGKSPAGEALRGQGSAPAVRASTGTPTRATRQPSSLPPHGYPRHGGRPQPPPPHGRTTSVQRPACKVAHASQQRPRCEARGGNHPRPPARPRPARVSGSRPPKPYAGAGGTRYGMTTTGRCARRASRPATEPKMRPTRPCVEPTTMASAAYSRPTSSSS